jgi:hypothetical protein
MFDDTVKKTSKMSMIEMIGTMRDMGEMSKMQDEIQQKALLAQQPDCVTIPYEDWQKYQYKVDDIIWIEITSDEKMEQ